MTVGSGAIARVTAVGPDATTLQVGQLTLVDIKINARDDPGVTFLFGVHNGGTPGSKKLMEGEWREATYAEYTKVPLENCYPLNEERLLRKIEDGGLGYKIHDLSYIPRLLVPYGGLSDLDVKAGETVVVAPATGQFGGAAVEVALAMGARVVAAARNEKALKRLADTLEKCRDGVQGRISIVALTGDVERDAKTLSRATGGKGLDAYIDFSPRAAAKSTHIKSCLLALKPFGRASFMGGIMEDISIPYSLMMFKSLQLRGKFMYDRAAVQRMIAMTEMGRVPLGDRAGLKNVGTFSLEQWEEAFIKAEENSGWGLQVVINP